VHDLIGKGVAEARRKQGLTQEELARRFQGRGLTAWRKGTVGQLEAGLRRPRLDEVLLMAEALHLTVDQLIPGGDDERVELGEGAVVSPRWIREMLTGELYDKRRPATEMPPAQFPVQEVISQALRRAGAERDRQRALIQPIVDGSGLDQWSAEVHQVFLPPTDVEAHAGRRLNVEPVQVKAASLRLWQQNFEAERDSRVGGVEELEPRSRQARRGLVTREMLTELRAFLDEAYAGQGEEGDAER
jgi:transcriptional regulator with XRE-family HTH domain